MHWEGTDWLWEFFVAVTVGFVAVFMDLWRLVVVTQLITVLTQCHCNITAIFCVVVGLGVYTDFDICFDTNTQTLDLIPS